MTTSIASAAMLVELNVSTWTARKQDKKTADEVTSSKSAVKGAASVNKHLLAGDDRLDKIHSSVGKFRSWFYENTIPWSDSGLRLIPTAHFLTFKQAVNDYEQEFNYLVDDFVQMYPVLVSGQAFKNGALFNRDEYPTQDSLKGKFRFRVAFSPVPEAGDFRVDIGSEMQEELRQQYERVYHDRVNAAMGDLWTRLKTTLDHLADRMSDNDDGTKKILRESVLDNALELVELLGKMNITKDPGLEKAKNLLREALLGITIEDLRSSKDARVEVKTSVSEILDKFNW